MLRIAAAGATSMAMTCEAARTAPEADRIRVGIRWEPGSMSFQQVTVKNGQMTRYGGTIEIVAAPTTVGATGRVRIEPGDQGNLGGGEIPAVVCE